VTNLSKTQNAPEGNLKFEFKIATSYIYEPELQAVSLDPSENEHYISLQKEQHASCDKLQFTASEYFEYHNRTFDCHVRDLPGHDTEIITITTEVHGVPSDMISKLKNGYL
jgi:hypothetical protein